jgi:DNA-directed RNA polymerase specialized sigma subunit
VRRDWGGFAGTPCARPSAILATIEDESLAGQCEALNDLERLSQRARLVVELRFFLAMTDADVAEAIGI